MVILYLCHLFTLVSYIFSAQCTFVGPSRGYGTGYPQLTSPGIAKSYNSSLNASRTAETEGNSKVSAPDTQDRSQAVGNGYWLADPAIKHGRMPWTGSNDYQFFRNVKDFGATGDGTTDDTAAINRAVSAMSLKNSASRCGWPSCGSSSTLGALVYFPEGKYLISQPIIQYYHTQFVGDPTKLPTIVGSSSFDSSLDSAMVALIDSNPYVPGNPGQHGEGQNWYIPENQFFRQIRNIHLDMTNIPYVPFPPTADDVTNAGPVGIHWQVAQGTSLQNVNITMPTGDSVSHIGISTENGSGGFVSDLQIKAGRIGWRVGSQQFTARSLTFSQNKIAVVMSWSWGFVWKHIRIIGSGVGFDLRNYDSSRKQGIGAFSLVDSLMAFIKDGIILGDPNAPTELPNMVLENLSVQSPQSNSSVVRYIGVDPPILAVGGSSLNLTAAWIMGDRVTESSGALTKSPGNQLIAHTSIPSSLKGQYDGRIFERSKPQYEDTHAKDVVSVTAFGALNDGTGDQSTIINEVLSAFKGSLVFFPAGVYAVANTINVPVGTRMVGEGWSQIMGFGPKFQDEANPRPIVKVGNPGDSGVLEMSDFLFTVRGPTRGAILVEWNVHQSTQGSAGMWDCHFRVGGAKNTGLTLQECPPRKDGTTNPNCQAASLLLHLTPQSSGYFENVWAWTADHDIDTSMTTPHQQLNPKATNIEVYSARGILIESQGPTWLYGTASEHNTLYQYQILNAANLWMGHIQSESPYFQPRIKASKPFTTGRFPGDPTFEHCRGASETCEEAWGLRIINSTNVIIHGAGLYSFFNSYEKCSGEPPSVGGICQERLFETVDSKSIWIYNLFTIGSKEVASPKGGQAVLQKDLQKGYSTEVSAWLPLAVANAKAKGSGV